MAKVLVTEDYLEDIGDAIRYKNGQAVNYTPPQMAQAIRNINTGGDLGTKNISANGTYNASSDGYDGYSSVTVNVQPSVGIKSISSNGTYNASSDNYDGYSSVDVNVSNSYSASDEGKVVSSGALVAQASMNISSNGTYDTTLKNEVVVSVPSSGGGGSGVLVEPAFQGLSYGYIGGENFVGWSTQTNYLFLFDVYAGDHYIIAKSDSTGNRFRAAYFSGKQLSDFTSGINSPQSGTILTGVSIKDENTSSEVSKFYNPLSDGIIAIMTSSESVAAIAYCVDLDAQIQSATGVNF